MTTEAILNRKSNKKTQGMRFGEGSSSQIGPAPKPMTTTPELMECGHARNGRNLVVCIDGTSNKFGDMVHPLCVHEIVCSNSIRRTQMIELYNLILKRREDNQRTWYNSGIGTYARPAWKTLSYYAQVVSNAIDLAFARNFHQTVLAAYRWLSDNYEDGDCIFLFGFSRGAFQVRILSAMIDKVGLIHKGNEMQIPFAYEVYADPKSDIETVAEVGEFVDEGTSTMAERFKKAFSHEGVKVHFVGAWDTVSSIGFTRSRDAFPRTIDGMGHRRVKFLPEYAYGGTAKDMDRVAGAPVYKQGIDNDPSRTGNDEINNSSEEKEPVRKRRQIKEVWFPGTHSDIGGGNVQNTGLNRSRPALRWMVFEAEGVGLRTSGFRGELSSEKLIDVRESLTGIWWFLEILPIKRLAFSREHDGTKITRKPHLGKGRKIHPGQKIHASFVLAKQTYVPRALPPQQVEDFWQGLKPESDDSEWLEFDLYDSIDFTVDNFIHTSGTDSAFQLPSNVAISGSGRKALYSKLFSTLKSEVDATIKYQLFVYTLNVLTSDSSESTLIKPVQSTEMRPLLQRLKNGNDAYDEGKILKFIKEFTDPCVFILRGHTNAVFSVAFSPDSKLVASGSWDATIRLWNAETGAAVQVLIGHMAAVRSVAFSPEATLVVSTSDDRTIRVWDLKAGSASGKVLLGDGNFLHSAVFSPDGKRVISASRDGTIRSWDVETGEAVGKSFGGYDKSIDFLAFSPDGKYVASGSATTTMRLWNVETGEVERESFGNIMPWITTIAFSPDSTRIVSGSYHNTVRVWNAGTGSADGEPFRGHTNHVNGVAFSPDGKRVVSGSTDTTVRIWNVETGKSDGLFEGHSSFVLSVAFSPDGRRVASGSWDNTIRIWDVET
ncbi:WD40-repeat-containing domain protein [Gymnopilus junonius]|uniref:WD40-repeat-containing domain protein n=1 Tax=Gymnopilus junonius TaxID=109634 RepID=A0A9P5TJU6_GYMJU|nr:WD40-repeat-containing domain protein [Gymnopilus junonius]